MDEAGNQSKEVQASREVFFLSFVRLCYAGKMERECQKSFNNFCCVVGSRQEGLVPLIKWGRRPDVGKVKKTMEQKERVEKQRAKVRERSQDQQERW